MRPSIGPGRSGPIIFRSRIGERLPVSIPDDVAAGHRVGSPGSREAARRFCHRRRTLVHSPHAVLTAQLKADAPLNEAAYMFMRADIW
jgi:hypothetical protein